MRKVQQPVGVDNVTPEVARAAVKSVCRPSECGGPRFCEDQGCPSHYVEEKFTRESRYCVIKYSHLSSGQRYNLAHYLNYHGIDTVEAVVVESDWPEYEKVWKMIEERVARENI